MSIRRIHLVIILFLIIEASLGFYIIKYTYRTKKQIWTYQSNDKITCIDITSTGSHLGIGGINGSISLVPRGRSTPVWRYDGKFSILTTKMTATGDFVVALDANDKFSLFSRTPRLREGRVQPLWTYNLPAGKLGGIYSTGGIPSLVYVVGSSGGSIVLLSKNGEKLWEYRTGAEDVVTTISEDGSLIATGDSNGNMRLFKLGTPNPIWSYPTKTRIVSIAVSFDSKFVVAGGVSEEGKGHIYLLSTEEGESIYHSQVDSPVRTTHISYNGQDVIADKEDGTAVIVHYEEDAVREAAFNFPDRIRSILFSPFGSFVTASNHEGEIYLYYLPRPAPLWRFNAQDQEPLIALTRKGEYIFVAASDKVHLLSNTQITEMIPGSRIGLAAVFFIGIGVLSSIVLKRVRNGFTQINRSDYLALSLGYLTGTLMGYLITKDMSKAVLVCGLGSALGSLIGQRGKSVTSFVSGCYLGCFGSGAAGYLIGLLIWFGGDERNVVQLTLSYVFDGLKIGVIFGPLGAIIGVFVIDLIISKVLRSMV